MISRTITIQVKMDVDPGVFDVDSFNEQVQQVRQYAEELFSCDGDTVIVSATKAG